MGAHLCFHAYVITAFMISSNDFSRGAHVIFFDIRWVFFLGVDISMTVSHFVLEKVSYEPHLKLPYRSSQKPPHLVI